MERRDDSGQDGRTGGTEDVIAAAVTVRGDCSVVFLLRQLHVPLHDLNKADRKMSLIILSNLRTIESSGHIGLKSQSSQR